MINSVMCDSIYGEYIQLTQKYNKKYGKNCVVLLQVGAFFEVYGFKCTETNDVQDSEICEFSRICNLNISEKKTTYNNKQVMMAGFRDYTLDKYLDKLTSSGFTAVVYVQEKTGNQITRIFDSVYSPGTYISYDTEIKDKLSNNIACIWMNVHKPVLQNKFSNYNMSKTRDSIIFGISIANMFTGKSYICEYQQPYILQPSTFDELERVISTHNPSEIIFVSPFNEDELTSIVQYSGIYTKNIHIVKSNSEKAEKCSQQKYISHILDSFYDDDVVNTCAEFSIYPTATQGFCYLLDFVQEHNPNLVKQIAIPSFHTNSEVILANHTLKQLNIIDDYSNEGGQCGHLSSVNSFLNKCSTSMGRRKFFTQLVNPTTNIEWLNKEYHVTDIMLSEPMYDYVPKIRKTLSQIRDIERICRQIVMRKIYPSTIYYLFNSIIHISHIYNEFSNNDIINYLHDNNAKYTVLDLCKEIQTFLNQNLDLDKCKSINSMNVFDECIIQPGVNTELDELIKSSQENNRLFNYIYEFFNKIMRAKEGKDVEYVKIHHTEKSGMTLQMTKKRANVLKSIIQSKKDEEIPGLNSTKWSDVKLNNASSNCDEISFHFLTNICRDLLHQKDYMNKLIAVSYLNILESFEKSHYEHLEIIAEYVSKVDVLMNKAYIAKENKYSKPEINETYEKSFVNVKGLRHLLIEHLQKKELYVANDITLGDNIQNGILLYGTNAVGKTSFIRALGISVICAQAGLFVPSNHFEYKPYKSIFSRIIGNDNLFKGLSTFAVEMSELRVILKLCSEDSLILGNELCAGTETESALSIFVSGVIEMHKKNSSFIFATHFHEIVHYQEVQDLSKMVFKHMTVYYDVEQDALVYDRKLMDGPGNKMYGLEVCKSLHLPDDFLKQAYEIRSKYFPETSGSLTRNASNYNASKIKGVCEICNNNLGTEIHHMQLQKFADKDGFITQQDGSVAHKNHKANLLTVCEKCHDEYHKEDENYILMRKKTTKGYKIEKSPPNKFDA